MNPIFLAVGVALAADELPPPAPAPDPAPAPVSDAARPSRAAVADTGQHLSPSANACLKDVGVPAGLQADRLAEGVRSEAYLACRVRLGTCETVQVTTQSGVEVDRAVVAEYPCGRMGTEYLALKAPDFLSYVGLPEAAATHRGRLTTVDVVYYGGLVLAVASLIPALAALTTIEDTGDAVPLYATSGVMLAGGTIMLTATQRPRIRTRLDPTRFVAEEEVQAATTSYDTALRARLQYVPAPKPVAAEPKGAFDFESEEDEDAAIKEAIEEAVEE